MKISPALASLIFNNNAARSLLTGLTLAKDLITSYPRQLRASQIDIRQLWEKEITSSLLWRAFW